MSAGLVGRLTELRESGTRGILFTVVEGEGVGAKALVVEGGETIGDGVPAEALAQFDEIVRRGRNRLVETDGSKVFAEWYGPPPRLFVYGAVDTAESLCARREAARLDGDRRGRARGVPHGGADPVGRPPDRRVAGRGARGDRARPPDGRRRPHARRQVRRARADRGARDRGVLHRRARVAAEPGAPTGAAARGRSLGGGDRADQGPLRPGHRRRHAGRDGPVDPLRDPRRPRRARRRAAQGREGAHPRRGRIGAASSREAVAAPKATPSGMCPVGGGDQAAGFGSCGIPLGEQATAPSSCDPPSTAGTEGAATAGTSRSAALRDSPGGETARTLIPVERSSQRSAAFARGACHDDVTTSTSPAPTRRTSFIAFAMLSTVVRASGSTTTSRAAPRHAARMSSASECVSGTRAQPESTTTSSERGHLRRALQARCADGVELATAAVRVAEDDDESRHLAHDRRRRSQLKKSSVPTTVRTSLTAFRPCSFDSPCARSRMWTATSSTRRPALFSRRSASTSGAPLT